MSKAVIITEKMDGSLANLIDETGGFSEEEAIEIMRQIVEIFYKYVYEKNIIHRDMKPGNILFNSLGNGKYLFKIADLGIVKSKDAKSFTRGVGTMQYMSP